MVAQFEGASADKSGQHRNGWASGLSDDLDIWPTSLDAIVKSFTAQLRQLQR
jgi:hypothetical protein